MANHFDASTSRIGKRISHSFFGSPKNIKDPTIFHKIALVPLLAWIGLGADGLSSSAYGPEEAFRALGQYSYLGIFLAVATIFTVSILSYSYSKIIEHFPNGGGGYIVASTIIGKKTGLVSGAALIIDYILTITVSIVSCSDAIFSYFPIEFQQFKIIFSTFLIILLIILNIRGTKESIKLLAPIFMIFIISHIFLLGYGIISNIGNFSLVTNNINQSITRDVSSIGYWGIILILLRAYSIGGGTYTGIEAVSNGLQIMREPKVKSGKRTMLYMAISLSLAAGGLFLVYVLTDVKFIPGKTLNAALANQLYQDFSFGPILAFITIFSEGALLFVAAQAGFIDAPRIMANMALDGWLPRKFAFFSEQLTMRNGIIIIGSLALLILYYTGGSISHLVVMYSINVFITFTISHFAMTKFYHKMQERGFKWFKDYLTFIIGLIVSTSILFIIIFEKFTEGGWMTLLVTLLVVLLSLIIKKHYDNVSNDLKLLQDNLDIKIEKKVKRLRIDDTNDLTAVQLVGSYDGFGIHPFMSLFKSFKGFYKNIIFVSVVVVDQKIYKNNDNVDILIKKKKVELEKYIKLANSFGIKADYIVITGTDIINSAYEECVNLYSKYKNMTVFTGSLSFQKDKFFHKILHNDTSTNLQKRLNFVGITNVILPIRIYN